MEAGAESWCDANITGPLPAIMKALTALSYVLAIATTSLAAAALPSVEQAVFSAPSALGDIGEGHFSEWSRNTKKEFLKDWQADKYSDWIFVLGNEGKIHHSVLSLSTRGPNV